MCGSLGKQLVLCSGTGAIFQLKNMCCVELHQLTVIILEWKSFWADLIIGRQLTHTGHMIQVLAFYLCILHINKIHLCVKLKCFNILTFQGGLMMT